MNIRIAAIAKDEGAYLAEWIFHHLHFGVSSIEIYVNRTTDNSYEILNRISALYKCVTVIDADGIANKSGANFQNQAYSDALTKARKESLDYLFFLDVDEFWTPVDFRTKITDFIKKLGSPDIVSFEWAIPSGDDFLFGPPFKSIQYLSKDRHVKTLFKTSLDITRIHVHNIEANNVSYYLSDGSIFENEEHNKYYVTSKNFTEGLRNAFVLHRVTRSQCEYISLLGRGRPSSKSGIKSNRWGYIPLNKNAIEFTIDENILNNYLSNFADFINDCNLGAEISTARKFILNRLRDFIKNIAESNDISFESLHALFKNVDLLSIKLLLNYIILRDKGNCIDINSINSLQTVLQTVERSVLCDHLIKKYLLEKLANQNITSILDEGVNLDLKGVETCR